MKKSLSVSRDEMTSETDYNCTYCDSNESIESCRVGETLELICNSCGRHGKATVKNGDISTGPFFKYNL